mmetsp:Transcript_25100/g.35155  ORF Transcript_25100/g.35155 Transcript_25100/m.35155 type:complete len:525 (+) Transcript_25100:139-1713(+)
MPTITRVRSLSPVICSMYYLFFLLSLSTTTSAFSSTIQQSKNHHSLPGAFANPSSPVNDNQASNPKTALFALPVRTEQPTRQSVPVAFSSTARSRNNRQAQKSFLFSATNNHNQASITANVTTTSSRSVVKQLRNALKGMILMVSFPIRKLRKLRTISKDTSVKDADVVDAATAFSVTDDTTTSTTSTDNTVDLGSAVSAVANEQLESFQQNIKHSLEMITEPINNLKQDTINTIDDVATTLQQSSVPLTTHAETSSSLEQIVGTAVEAAVSAATHSSISSSSITTTAESEPTPEIATVTPPMAVASATSTVVLDKPTTTTASSDTVDNNVAVSEDVVDIPVGDRWAVSHPDVDLSGEWSMIVDEEFKQEYDEYLKQLGQPMIVRSVAVGIIGRTTEETKQLDHGRQLWIRGVNARGVWERTLEASGTCYQRHTHDPETDATLVPVETADAETVVAESWWENQGTIHRSWLRGGVKYGGGDFESKRYLEQDGKVLVCESTFHPKDTTRSKAQIAWRFLRTGETL